MLGRKIEFHALDGGLEDSRLICDLGGTPDSICVEDV